MKKLTRTYRSRPENEKSDITSNHIFTTPLKVNNNTIEIPDSQTTLSEQKLRDSVVAYLKDCIEGKTLPQTAGLLIDLGLSREQWNTLSEKYPTLIQRANHFIEKVWVEKLLDSNATGAMFYLKNTFRDLYKDKSETDVTIRIPRPILDGVTPLKLKEEKRR